MSTATTIRPIVREHSGERRLYLAVLGDALARLAGANPEGVPPSTLAAQRDEVRAWIAARGEAEGGPFAFDAVCAALGLAASPIRRAILAGTFTGASLVAHIARRVEARPRLSRK